MQLTADRSPDVGRRPRPIYRVFVSSTWLDLQPERAALQNALHRMEEMRFVGMEFFGNRPDDTHAASIDQVDACDVFIGVIGFRYGSGITEAEYRRARELGLPCFIYFKDHAAFHPELTDDDPAAAAKLDVFKAGLMREHTVKSFPSPAELAANATADLHNWIAARWVSSEAAAPAPARERPAGAKSDRISLLRLVERIEHDWVEGVLEASLHHRARLELGLNWNADAVEHPWDRIVVAPNRPIQRLQREDSVGALFDAAQHTLLVLGEPGAGKTTSLLELARDLIRRARQSADEAVPVVLALSTWRVGQSDFDAWLIAELAMRYQVPKRLARVWIDEGRFVLLLDGLDEVTAEAREACVTAINAFQETHPPSGLAVTCRVAEYAALPRKLRLRAAICLQPLAAEQVDRYLAAAGPQLASLARALRDDAGLREMARTPLLLNVMTMAWRDAAVVELGAGTDSADERRRKIFEAYVQAMVRRPGKAVAEYSPERTVEWLSWLARGMKAQGYTLFALEQLQPGWLPVGVPRVTYYFVTRLGWAFGIAAIWLGLEWVRLQFSVTAALARELFPRTTALLFGAALVLGILLGTLDSIADWLEPRRFSRYRRLVAMIVTLSFAATLSRFAVTRFYPESSRPAVIISAAVAAYLLMVGLAFCRAVEVRTNDIHPPDTMRWSWRAALDRFLLSGIGSAWIVLLGFVGFASVAVMRAGFANGLRHVGVNSGMLLGLAAGLAGGIAFWRWRRARWTTALLPGLVVFPVTGATLGAWFGPAARTASMCVVFSAIVALLIGVAGGFVFDAIDPARARRTGLWLWLRVPTLAAASILLLVGGPLAIVDALYWRAYPKANLAEFVSSTTLITTFLMVIVFVRFGGVSGLQHYFLRWLLVRRGDLPRRAEAFFAHATQLALLQRVGLGYRFVHALLVEHLAARVSSSANPKPE